MRRSVWPQLCRGPWRGLEIQWGRPARKCQAVTCAALVYTGSREKAQRGSLGSTGRSPASKAFLLTPLANPELFPFPTPTPQLCPRKPPGMHLLVSRSPNSPLTHPERSLEAVWGRPLPQPPTSPPGSSAPNKGSGALAQSHGQPFASQMRLGQAVGPGWPAWCCPR